MANDIEEANEDSASVQITPPSNPDPLAPSPSPSPSPSPTSLSAPALVLSNSGKRIEQAGKKKYVKQVTGRHNDTELHLAAQRGDLATIKQIFSDISTQMGETLGGTELDIEVAEVRAAMVNEVNELEETALLIAADKGHIDVVKELLCYSNKETLTKKNKSGFDPFHVAASKGHLAIVQLLLDHDISLSRTIGTSNATPLITAATRGHTAVVKELLSRDSSLAEFSKSNGKNALHFAARQGHVEIVRVLLDKDRSLAKKMDKKEQTALHMAVKGLNCEVVKSLLEADSTVVAQQDKFGNTPLHIATRKKRVEIVNTLLLWHNIIDPNALNKEQKTPLDIVEDQSLSEESSEIKAILVQNGALRAKELNQPRRDELRQTVTQIKNDVHRQLEQTRKTNKNVYGIAKELRKLHREGINNATNSVTVVAVLFATVAFAAIFTLPGGDNDDGSAVVATTASFRVFFVFNAIALFTSLAVVVVQITLVRGETKAEKRVAFEELDYINEGENGTRFAEMMKKDLPQVVVPKTYEKYTTRKVLTTQWIDGEKLSQSTADDVGSLVNVGVICYLKQLLDTGFFHADPHPGNLIRTPDGKLAILDFGLVTKLTDDQKYGMIEAIAHLIHRDYDAIVKDFVKLDFIPDGVNLQPLLPVLAKVFDQALEGGGAKNINFQELASDLAQITFDYPFRIPPYFALIIRAIGVLEGIALVGNPEFAIVDEAYPYIAQRLLTDESPRLRNALRYTIYGKSGVFDAERFVDVMQAFESFITAAKSGGGEDMNGGMANLGVLQSQPGSAFPRLLSNTSQMDNQVQTRAALGFLLSDKGNFFREFLLDEIVKGIDAVSREQLLQILAFSGIGNALPMLARIPSFGPIKPTALVPTITEEDEVTLNNVQRVLGFLTSGGSLTPMSMTDVSRITPELFAVLFGVSAQVLPEVASRLTSRVMARLVRNMLP